MNKEFKKSKLGFIPSSWEVLQVQELINLDILDIPLDGNHGESHPKGDDFVNEGVPFVMASDINEGVVDLKSCKKITLDQASSLRKGFSVPGDVLLTHKASLGRTAIVPEVIEGEYIMLTPQVTYYRIKDYSRLNNLYLKYYFDCSAFQETLNLWGGSGSTRAYLGITAQKKLPILLPPIEIQKKIAAILSTYDNLIENNTKRIAILEQMAEQIYKEWFVRMRFPGYENTKFVKGVPEGWEILPLELLVNDILDKRGVTPAKLGGDWQEEGVSALSALNVKTGKLIKVDECKKVSESLYQKWMKQELEINDILLTSEAPLGEVYLLRSRVKYVLSQRLYAIRPNTDAISPVYLYYYLIGPVGQGAIQARATGSTVGGIRQSLLREVEIIKPTENLYKSFEDLVGPMLDEINNLDLMNKELLKSRDLLLPRLISGKLSVEQAAQKLEEVS
jgi:type I restriction enzyme S subunit